MVNDLFKCIELLAIVVLTSEVDLVIGELVTTVSSNQALAVDEVEAIASIVLAHSLTHEEFDNLLGNTHTGRAGAEEDRTVVLARHTRTLDGIDDSTQDDGTGTLDVIVEAGVGVPIPLECWKWVLEVLELDDDTKQLSLAMMT